MVPPCFILSSLAIKSTINGISKVLNKTGNWPNEAPLAEGESKDKYLFATFLSLGYK